MTNCPICNQNNVADPVNNLDTVYLIDCPRCGRFTISDQALSSIKNGSMTSAERNKIASFIRVTNLRIRSSNLTTINIVNKKTSNQSYQITIEEILNRYPEELSDRIDQILINLSKMSEYPGRQINVVDEDTPLFYVLTDNDELEFIINSLVDEGLISNNRSSKTQTVISLTTKGWRRITEIQRVTGIESKQVFIAMWFDKEMDIAADRGIKAAISEAGFKPLRIDWKQHNERIDAEIITEIKRSRFLVVDVTGDRSGVYFEAGYALGMGLPVIWTCRKGNEEDMHFDTRQYNHIIWENEDDLRNKLYYRIKATIL